MSFRLSVVLCAASHHRLVLGPCASASALCTSRRAFIQGGPPPQKEDKNKMRQMLEPDKKEFEERYQQRLREVHEYYANEEPGKPAPLPENAFVKGQFGMRRRIHRGMKGQRQYDPDRLEEAMAEGVNAYRK